MKYTNPVCEIYELSKDDVITTSVVMPKPDTPVVPSGKTSGGSSIMGSDNGFGGAASN